MTTDDGARFRPERLAVAEASDAADGWRFLTVDNLAPNGHADALRYEKALDAFDRAAGDLECRHRGRRHGLTFGIRGDDAEQRIAWLRTRLEELRPPTLPGHGTWDIRDGAR
ncbi:hypothetical protein [Streptacidiphilus jiangxiensis]|uniref:Uncharacterized protein n=1 Tax=Streptacidiphilus jiangxiensis TaxID=235985 RepID=A0A1H7ZYP6_STRJI|nr:hypothetical protein [Streptacidiphilus jiangxiensis]SEM62619.1 hypothetical protein SAMN05414137_13845 [Streptacidiphilus jiangxiensis]